MYFVRSKGKKIVPGAGSTRLGLRENSASTSSVIGGRGCSREGVESIDTTLAYEPRPFGYIIADADFKIILFHH